MNQLTGRYVNVVLAVEEGKGMDFIKHPVNISANCNGRILESDSVQPEDCPAFNTELVWEIEKKDLRKIRSANQPLRVECISTDQEKRKERIGFILLSLRSACVIPLNDAKNEIKFTWQKLIGVQHDKKNCHPELFLALTIKDHLINQTEQVSENIMPFIMEEEQVSTSDDSGEGFINSGIPVMYLEDGFIRIGHEKNATKMYTLNILMKSAFHLDLLLPEKYVFSEVKEKYFMSFKLFGIAIKTKTFSKDLHETIELNEKIVVKLLTNLATLKEYLDSQLVEVIFCCGKDKLGGTKINLNEVIIDDSDEEFCNTFKCSEECFFSTIDENNVPESEDGRKPVVHIECSVLKLHDKKTEPVDQVLIPSKSLVKTVISNIEKNLEGSGAGDQETSSNKCDLKLGKLKKIDRKAQSEHGFIQEPHDNFNSSRTKSLDTFVTNVILPPRKADFLDVQPMYSTFALTVSLESVYWRKYLNEAAVTFKILHPKTACNVTLVREMGDYLGEDTQINIEFKIFYISTSENVKQLVKAWPPKIVLFNEKDKQLSQEVEINTDVLLESSTRNCTTKCDVKAVRTLEYLGKITVNLVIDKIDSQVMSDIYMNGVLLPPVLDEAIIIEEIKDLQNWKDAEKNVFKKELRAMEIKSTAKLQQDWLFKKQDLEEKLGNQIRKCKDLHANLKKSFDKLKTEKSLKKSRKKGSLAINYLKYAKYENKELIEILTKLEIENDKLREIVTQQRNQLESFEKSALTKEQTTKLLQEVRGLEEKFLEAQKAKSYFKDQWKKACEEIHDLKTEDYKQLQSQLQENRAELSQLSLDDFLENIKNENIDDFEDLYAREGLETARNCTK